MSDSSKPSKIAKSSQRSWLFQLLIEVPSGLLVLVVAFIMITILTSFGRTTLSNIIVNAIPLPQGYELSVTKLESPSIGKWTFESVSMSQHSEPVLHMSRGTLNWAALNIIRGQILIPQLSIQQITLEKPIETLAQSRQAPATDKSNNPFENLTNPLESLDKKVEDALEKFAIQFMPMSIEQLDLDRIQLKHKNTDYTLSLNGDIDVGIDDNLIHADLFGTIKTKTITHPLEFNIETAMFFNRDIQLSVSTSVNHTFKNTILPIKANLNTMLYLQEKPYALQIQNSTIAVGQEHFQIHGQLKILDTALNIETVTIEGFQGITTLKGVIVKDGVDINGSISQLNPSSLLPETMSGIFNSDFSIKGSLKNPTLTGGLTSSGTINDEAAFISSDFYFQQPTIQFSNTVAKLGIARAQTQGTFNLKDKRLSLTANIDNLHLSQISALKVPIPKEVDLIMRDTNAKIHFQFRTESKEPELDLQAQGQFLGSIYTVPSDINGNVHIDLNQLTLLSAMIQFSDTHAVGNGVLNWRKDMVDLHFLADNVTPNTISWLPLTIPDIINSNLHTDIVISQKLTKPLITVQATGPVQYQKLDLNTNCTLSTELTSIHLHRCHFFSSPDTISQSVSPQKLMNHTGTINFKPLKIALKHEFFLFPIAHITQAIPITTQIRNNLELEGKIQGVVHTQFSLNTKTDKLMLDNARSDIGIFGKAWSEALFGGLRAEVTRKKQGYQADVQSLGIDYGDESYLVLKASANNKTLDLNLDAFAKAKDFKQLPFESLDSFTQWPARLKIKSTAQGDLAAPTIDGAIEYTADIQQINSLGKNTKVPLKIQARFEKPKTKPLKLGAQIFKEQQLQSEFSLETNWFSNFLADMLSNQPLQPLEISSQGQMDLENLNILLSPVFHQFNGLAFWNWHWNSDPIKSQPLIGNIEIRDGAYQHLTIGTNLESANIRMQFENNGIAIQEGQARDGAAGQYKLKGFLNFDDFFKNQRSKQPIPMKTNVQLRLDKVQLVDRPDIESQAHGDVQLVKHEDELMLKGKIQLQPLEIQLDRTQSDQIEEIDVIKYNPRFKTHRQKNQTHIPINLELDLYADQQTFLRGKGINAELEGRVAVRGTLKEPQMNGFFKTVRGDADILGKRFIINNGELRFEGYRALLSIEATHSKINQDFIAKVSGSLDSLNVILESEPRLPEDETLSQLLFGKALDDISAIQALRIGAAVRSFSSNNGGGLDPLATTRSLLGVDQVTLDSENTDTGDENYKLGVGKYVSDKVYVEIQRSTDPTEPWQGKVQIEITPNVSLDTSAESNTGFNGIDINWKRDY